ncbi:MAG: CdaR family protein [Acidobacteriota bacterium]|nr:CdaR family protein [Acidobacteriota bacterium]MDH3525056.1 CdaR family protein [Acidobacteriota bacterium]
MNDSRGLWGLRLLALGLAGLAWFIFSGEKREPLSEKVIDAAVRYDLPESFLLLERVEMVRVSARGPLSKIRSLTAPFIDVFVDLPAQEGVQQVALGSDQVILPEGLEVVSVEPNVIEVTLDRLATRFVPVEATLAGEPAAGARVLSTRVVPNKVLVAGPASRIAALEGVNTLPVDLSGHARDFEMEVAVRPPEPLINIQEQPTVNVIIRLEIPGVEPADIGDEASPVG